MKCPKCGASKMFKVYDIDSSQRNDEHYWCLCCSLEGKAEELLAKAQEISKRVRRNPSSS